jgi:hypothetical protein
MARSILASLLVFLSLAASPLAIARERPALGENARLWLSHISILEVDGKKPKSHIHYLDLPPGEHAIALKANDFTIQGIRWIEFRATTVLVSGHTYSWQYDQDAETLVFTDLGKDFVIPKQGLVWTPKAYLQAVVDARAMPPHRVVLTPTAEWED